MKYLIFILLALPFFSIAEEDRVFCGELQYKESRSFADTSKDGMSYWINGHCQTEINPEDMKSAHRAELEMILNLKTPYVCIYGNTQGGCSAVSRINEIYEISTCEIVLEESP